MDYRTLIKDVQLLYGVYLFKGEEEYLIDNTVDLLRKEIVAGPMEDLNYLILDGKNTNLESIITACETLPLMSEKKLVVLKNISDYTEIKENEKLLVSYLDKVEDHVVFLIIDNKDGLKKTTSLYKKIKKMNRDVEFNRLDSKEFKSWVTRVFKQNKKEIPSIELAYLVEKLGYSNYGSEIKLYEIQNELNKILHIDSGTISKKNIDDLLTKKNDENIFGLLDGLIDKDGHKSLEIFHSLIEAKEPIQRILFMITRQYRNLSSIKSYKEVGYGEKQIREKLNLKPFEYKKLASKLNSLTLGEINRGLHKILETDIKQKTTSQDEILLMEILIVELTSI